MPFSPRIRAIVFDLDGTLVDSALDFDAMRLEMGLSHNQPILEAIEALADHDAARCREILHRHEFEGGQRAVLMPGVPEFLAVVRRLGLHTAVWTRNSRAVALATLARTGLEFEVVVARDDAPAKPDPTALVDLAGRWDLKPAELLMVGDWVFDIEAGRNAGARTALYTAGAAPEECEGHELADWHFASFHDTDALLRWMGHGECRHS